MIWRLTEIGFQQTWYWSPLKWRNKERDGVSNHRRLEGLFRRKSKKTSKLRFTGLCEGNSAVTGGFPSQGASIAENVSIWWRHHVFLEYSEPTPASIHGWNDYQGMCALWMLYGPFKQTTPSRACRIKVIIVTIKLNLLNNFEKILYPLS